MKNVIHLKCYWGVKVLVLFKVSNMATENEEHETEILQHKWVYKKGNKIWLEILKAFIIICQRPYVAHCMLYVCILYTCVFGSIKTELEEINSRDGVFKMKNFCLNFYFVIKDMLIKIKMSLNFIWETKIYY